MDTGPVVDTSPPNEEEMEVGITDTRTRQPSRRVVRPPRGLSPQMRGKSHKISSTDKDDHVNQFRGHEEVEGHVEMEH